MYDLIDGMSEAVTAVVMSVAETKQKGSDAVALPSGMMVTQCGVPQSVPE